MALAASTPMETLAQNQKFRQIGDDLDDEITSIRAEIQKLTNERNTLCSSLMTSTNVQAQLTQAFTTQTISAETESLLAASQKHAQQNIHRLAFGVTAFPFTDPSPETSNNRLLGVRIDLSDRKGQYDKPYYLLCKRPNDSGNELRIHRHTIPAFIPLRKYEELYLPVQDEVYGSEKLSERSHVQQDLHALVRAVRRDLVSWKLRCEAIEFLREELGLQTEQNEDSEMIEVEGNAILTGDASVGKYGVKSLVAAAVEARYARLQWTNGCVGRLKISDQGVVERAVVFDELGRVRDAETILDRDQIGILDMMKKLEAVDKRFGEDQEGEQEAGQSDEDEG